MESYGTLGTGKHTCRDIITSTSDCYQHAVWGLSVEKICPLTADRFLNKQFWSHGYTCYTWTKATEKQKSWNEPKGPKSSLWSYTSTPNLHPCSNRIASWPLDLPNFAPLIPHWRAVAPTWLEKENLWKQKVKGAFHAGLVAICCHSFSEQSAECSKKACRKQWWRRNGFKFQSASGLLQDFKAKKTQEV